MKKNLLIAALAAAIAAAVPAFAQDATLDPATVTTTVAKERLVDAYADALFGGDEAAASAFIVSLRDGSDFTVSTEVERQAVNEDGTPKVDAEGNPVMETIVVESVVANAAGPMGWGEVDHSLALAEAMVGQGGDITSMEQALLGGSTVTTVTNEDGSTTTTVTYDGEGILGLRADGMGWGQIAKELGFKSLGEVKSGRVFADSSTAKAGKADRAVAAKAEKAAKVDKADRIAKVDRPDRPAKIDRPDRPERPVKPERPGRP